LGSENFIARVGTLLEAKGGSEEVRWVSRLESAEARQAAGQAVAKRQEQRCWQIWARVILGGERRVDLAREYGYRDGSAITQMLKRLQRSAQTDPDLQTQMNRLQKECATYLSSVKS
jgi:hypothetical protein